MANRWELAELHPRTDSLMQFNLLKGTYYNINGEYDDNLLHNTHIHLRLKNDPEMAQTLERFTNVMYNLKEVLSRKQSSVSGFLYLEVKEKKQLEIEIIKLKSELSKIRGDIISFNIHRMQDKKLMGKRITRLQLAKLPLTLKGGIHSPQTEDDDDDIEEEFDDV